MPQPRRLGDRFATECVLSTVRGEEPPDWVQDSLDELPGLLRSAMSRASALDRAVVATVPGELGLGAEVEVEVVAADPVGRSVELAVR